MLSFALVAFGLLMSTMHLGKPRRFYRGFNNLRHSPVSREALGIAIFIGALGMHVLFSLPANNLFQSASSGVFGVDASMLIGAGTASAIATAFGYLCVAAGAAGLYYMNQCYRIKARPFWNHWQVATAFAGSALSLGSLLALAVAVPTLVLSGGPYQSAAILCGGLLALGMAIEGIGHLAHARALGRADHEGGASYYIQTTTFGKTFMLRNTLLGLNLLLAGALLAPMLLQDDIGSYTLLGWGVVGAIALVTSLLGRALFYVLVIPTTMPGAFFWKNKGFEEHARDIGLANLPQVGVAPLRHHP